MTEFEAQIQPIPTECASLSSTNCVYFGVNTGVSSLENGNMKQYKYAMFSQCAFVCAHLPSRVKSVELSSTNSQIVCKFDIVIYVNVLFRTHFNLQIGDVVKFTLYRQETYAMTGCYPRIIDCIDNCVVTPLSKTVIAPDFADNFIQYFADVPLNNGYPYVIKTKTGNVKVKMNFSEDTNMNIDYSRKRCRLEYISDTTVVHFANPAFNKKEKEDESIFKSQFNFDKMDIGGLDTEFVSIFRRAFTSRIMPLSVRKQLGIKDIKGIMLHGPPGCGKTLIARKLAEVVNCKTIQIVTGPSLLHGLIGKSEENVRDLFKDAKADWSENPNTTAIHVVIVDECDAVFSKRGSKSGVSGDVNDNMVNQFLSMIDGPESIGNVLLICMTNNIHSIDEAVIRPGRIELLLEIKLPDTKGRTDIFNIHLRKIAENHRSPDIQLDSLVSISENFTGAEIEGSVENAKSYAMSRLIDVNSTDLKTAVKNMDFNNIVITQSDLERSIRETIPAFGSKSAEMSILLERPFVKRGLVKESWDKLGLCIGSPMFGKVSSAMICGPVRSGKTTLACNFANSVERGCIRFINADTFMTGGYNGESAATSFYKLIKESTRSVTSTIIIDSVENIIRYSPLGNHYDSSMLHVIQTSLAQIVNNNQSVRIILTSSEPELMECLGLHKRVLVLCELTEYSESDDLESNAPSSI